MIQNGHHQSFPLLLLASLYHILLLLLFFIIKKNAISHCHLTETPWARNSLQIKSATSVCRQLNYIKS